jgi:GNAT superfamily N-acetyltransferase
MKEKIPFEDLERRCAIYRVNDGFLFSLRNLAFWPFELNTDIRYEHDKSPDTWHMILAYQEQPDDPQASDFVCCASFAFQKYDNHSAYLLQGLGTAPTFQNQGFGRILLSKSREHIVCETGLSLFWCKAPVATVKFFEKCGWYPKGGISKDDENCLYQIMTKKF